MRSAATQRGQATVELALLLPLVVALCVAVIAAGLVARDQIALSHVAREAARAAAVDPDPAAVRRAASLASNLDRSRLATTVSVSGGGRDRLATVRLSYRPGGGVPVVGWLMARVSLSEEFTVAVEPNQDDVGVASR